MPSLVDYTTLLWCLNLWKCNEGLKLDVKGGYKRSEILLEGEKKVLLLMIQGFFTDSFLLWVGGLHSERISRGTEEQIFSSPTL